MIPIPADASFENSWCMTSDPNNRGQDLQLTDRHYHSNNAWRTQMVHDLASQLADRHYHPKQDTLENDPIVKLFLEKYLEISLSDGHGYSNSGGNFPNFWIIPLVEGTISTLDRPGLFITMDHCFDIAKYVYYDENSTATIGVYKNHNNVIAAITGEEIQCENPKDEYPDLYAGREQLENDLLFRGFMKTNSNLQLGEPELTTINRELGSKRDYDLYAPYMWQIGRSVYDYYYTYTPSLRIELDKCFNVAYYGYAHSENGPWVQGSYDENYHNVLKTITGKPFTPYVQATFYEIPIRDVQCNNDGNSLYMRDGTKPICLKEQTYETLLERGFNLQKTIS